MKCFLCGLTPMTPPDISPPLACPCCKATFPTESCSIKISTAGSGGDNNNFSISLYSSQANAVPKEIAVRVDGSLVLDISRFRQKMSLILDENGLAQIALYCQSGPMAAQDDEQRPRTYLAKLGGHEEKVEASVTDWVLDTVESTKVQ